MYFMGDATNGDMLLFATLQYLYENVTIVLHSQKNVFQKLAYFNLNYCLVELKVKESKSED